MKIATNCIALVVLFAGAFTSSAQQGQFSPMTQGIRWCDPTGTWYGGSDMQHPYQIVFAPTGIGRYSVRAQEAVDYASFGLVSVTDWTGEMTIRPGLKSYDAYLVAYFLAKDDQGNEVLEMDAVHSIFQFGDNCNVLRSTVDTYIVYVPWTPDKIAFVTDPDFNPLQGGTIEETYQRMAISCEKCPFASVPAPAAKPERARLPGRLR